VVDILRMTRLRELDRGGPPGATRPGRVQRRSALSRPIRHHQRRADQPSGRKPVTQEPPSERNSQLGCGRLLAAGSQPEELGAVYPHRVSVVAAPKGRRPLDILAVAGRAADLQARGGGHLRRPGKLSVFVHGTDGAIWYRTLGNGRWGGWTRLGGKLLPGTGPAAAYDYTGHLLATAVGTDRGHAVHAHHLLPRGDTRPPMTSSSMTAARSQYLLDLLAQVPDPRKRRRRRHALAGLLAVGIAAVIAGSRSFAAIGQCAADAGPEALAVLGAARGPAEESTFRRAFDLVSADVLDRSRRLAAHRGGAGRRPAGDRHRRQDRARRPRQERKTSHLVAALANNRTALTASQPRPPVSPTSSSNRFTPCAYRQPEYLPGQVCVQALRSPSGRNPQNCYICLSPTTARAESRTTANPPPPQRVPARPRRKCSTRSDGVQRTRGGDPWSARDRAGRRRNRRTVLSQRKACVATGLTPDVVGRRTLGGANHDRSAVAGLGGSWLTAPLRAPVCRASSAEPGSAFPDLEEL